MFLISFYPIVKIAAMIATLWSTHIYKNYTQLTFHQKDFILNMRVKDVTQAKQAADLLDVFTQANAIKESFPQKNQLQNDQSWEDFKKNTNPKCIDAFNNMILKDIDPLIKNYTKKYAYPTKTELIKAIFEDQ